MEYSNHKNKNIIIHPNDHKNTKDWNNIFGFLDKNLDYSSINSVLDLGAGTGNISCNFINKNNKTKCLAVDVDDGLLDSIKNRDGRIEILNHDINVRLPLEDNSFDLVSCLGTLHYGYIKNPYEVIAEMKRVSRKYVLLDFFLKDSLYSFLESIRYPKYEVRKYSKSDIANILKLAELKVVAAYGGRAIFPGHFPHSGKEVFYICKI